MWCGPEAVFAFVIGSIINITIFLCASFWVVFWCFFVLFYFDFAYKKSMHNVTTHGKTPAQQGSRSPFWEGATPGVLAFLCDHLSLSVICSPSLHPLMLSFSFPVCLYPCCPVFCLLCSLAKGARLFEDLTVGECTSSMRVWAAWGCGGWGQGGRCHPRNSLT